MATVPELLHSIRDLDEREALKGRLLGASAPKLMRLMRLSRRLTAHRQQLIVVTGTQGKTSTTRILRAALHLPALKLVEQSANYRGQLAMTYLRQSPLRPHAVLEVGLAFPGSLRRQLRGLRPNVTVVTCLGSEHLGHFRDVDHLRDEKAMSVRALGPRGVAVLNGDDPNVMWMAGETRGRIVTFGLGPGCDIRGANLTNEGPVGSRFTVTIDGVDHDVRSRFLGETMMRAMLAAIAVVVALGLPLEPALERIARVRPTRGRNQPMRLRNGAWAIVDDFKSSIETIAPAIELLASVPAARRVLVIGAIERPPGRAKDAYLAVGRMAAAVVQEVIVVGSRELDRRYWPGLRDGGMDRANVRLVGDAAEAGLLLRDSLGQGDVVLFKGRHEERLVRAALMLAGRDVRCRRASCKLATIFCNNCPMLERPQQ